MAPCCGEVFDITNKQVVIICVVILVCVVIAVGLLLAGAKHEFQEIQDFHFGFVGRQLLIRERKLVYKSSSLQVRYEKENGNGHLHG